MKSWPEVAKFGLAVGLCSAIFKITKCLIKYLNIVDMKPSYENFIAGALSSLSLSLVNEKELTLLTMIIYPRVIEVICRLLADKGWIKNFKYSDIVSFMVCSSICVYCYIFEPSTLSPNYVKAINNFALISQGEGTMFATVAEQTTRSIENYYGVKQSR